MIKLVFDTEIKFKTKSGYAYLHTFSSHKMEVLNRGRAAKIAQAIAYQETLGVTGKPQKKRA